MFSSCHTWLEWYSSTDSCVRAQCTPPADGTSNWIPTSVQGCDPPPLEPGANKVPDTGFHIILELQKYSEYLYKPLGILAKVSKIKKSRAHSGSTEEKSQCVKNHWKTEVTNEKPYRDKPKVLIFIFLSLTYMLSVTGNLTIITVTLMDPHLKTHMYFFLRNYSFLELSFTPVFISRFLYNMSSGDYAVTYNACFTQLFFVVLLGASEFLLLAAMSYDHYVAICKPLHYTTIINNRVCNQLLLSCWLCGLMIILLPLGMGLELEFCDSNIIDHFLCNAAPFLDFTCCDTQVLERMILVSAVLTLIITLVLVVLSCAYIVRTILRLPSAQQRKKAFSTYSFHMIVVSMTYGTCIFIYIKTSEKEGVALNKVVSILATSVAPVLSPFIYTLRNKQVIQAFRDTFLRIILISKQKR
ncbi:olfactory receptor 6C2-like [Trichosurus vulpecula]|uniref:olfactory receptor 6C2-like n=1 Tax=Trichosurus vulpecula TaxID=9337 RepID=UPI00186B4E2C|nr:olfactory receptor 6C2-like [Trichosurus vulpecula]